MSGDSRNSVKFLSFIMRLDDLFRTPSMKNHYSSRNLDYGITVVYMLAPVSRQNLTIFSLLDSRSIYKVSSFVGIGMIVQRLSWIL